MKKVISFLLLFSLFLGLNSTAMADIDLHDLSDSEIIALIHDCQATLAERKIDPEKVLYQDDAFGITVSITGYKFQGKSFSVMGTVVNRSDKTVKIRADSYEVYVNNWKAGVYGNRYLEAAPGKNAKAEIFETVN